MNTEAIITTHSFHNSANNNSPDLLLASEGTGRKKRELLNAFWIQAGPDGASLLAVIWEAARHLPFYWLLIQHQYNALEAKLLNTLPIRLAVSWIDQWVRETDVRFSSLEPITQVNCPPPRSTLGSAWEDISTAVDSGDPAVRLQPGMGARSESGCICHSPTQHFRGKDLKM